MRNHKTDTHNGVNRRSSNADRTSSLRLFRHYGRAVLVAIVQFASAAFATADEQTRHYIEFLARPSTCLIGHSYVRIGTVWRGGSARVDATIGLYPARYPRTDAAALFAAPGRIMNTRLDTEANVTARYRLDVSRTTHRKALAHVAAIKVKWRRYDLATENCNAVVFEFADRLGLKSSRDMMDLPVNIVRSLQTRNGGRSRASWRP